MVDIHSQLQQDCLLLGRFQLSHLLLVQDRNYPWFILVPDRENVAEIFQLLQADQVQLMKESALLAQMLKKQFNADKLNIAALGNVVPQLHLHHIVRYRNDATWPAPVWGKLPALAYSTEQLQDVVDRIKPDLGESVKFCV